MKSSAAAIKGHQKDVDAIMTGLRGSAKDMADVIDSLGPEVDASGKAALKAAEATIMKMQTAQAKHRQDLGKFQAQEARKASMFTTAMEDMKKQDADSALELGITRDRKFIDALRKANVSHSVVDGVIKIAKKDRETALKLFAGLGAEGEVAARAAGRATLKQTLRTQKILSEASTESLTAAISLHERAGKNATELRKQLTSKIEQASMLAALKKADPAKFQKASASNTDIKKAYEDYKKSLATSTDAAAQQKLLDIQKEVDADLKKHLPDIAGKMKLEKLEAAESTLRQLEALKHVPRRLAAVKKSIAGIKLKNVEEEVRIVFDKMAGIASILNDQADRDEFKQLRVTAVDELMNFDALASSTKDTVVTVNQMLKAIGGLPASGEVDALMDRLKNAYGNVIKFGRNVIGDRTSVSAIVTPLEELKSVMDTMDEMMLQPNLSDTGAVKNMIKSITIMKKISPLLNEFGDITESLPAITTLSYGLTQLDEIMDLGISKNKANKIVGGVKKLKGVIKPLAEFGDVTASLQGLADVSFGLTQLDEIMDLGISKKKAKGIVSGVKTLKGVVKHMGKFEGVAASLESIDDLSYGLAQLDKVMASPLLSDSAHAAEIVKSVQTMKGLLSPINETVAEVQAFSGGNLNVTHNLPNTQINMQVNINSKELATAIALTNIGKDTANGKAFMATQPTPAAVEGKKA